MRVTVGVLSALVLAACQTTIPDSGAGVGFDDYSTYQAEREAQLAGQPDTVLPPADVASSEAEQIAQEASAVVISANNPEISDENSFEAVSSRESIESDKARLEAQREQYEFIEPTALPSRTSTGSNIVQYALSTTNAVGQPIYKRSIFANPDNLAKKCSKYGSPDLAQIAFLDAGGPEKDRLGVDPDGDGFACFWDPTPFRAALR